MPVVLEQTTLIEPTCCCCVAVVGGPGVAGGPCSCGAGVPGGPPPPPRGVPGGREAGPPGTTARGVPGISSAPTEGGACTAEAATGVAADEEGTDPGPPQGWDVPPGEQDGGASRGGFTSSIDEGDSSCVGHRCHVSRSLAISTINPAVPPFQAPEMLKKLLSSKVLTVSENTEQLFLVGSRTSSASLSRFATF